MNHLNKVTVELKLKIFLMLNFEMEKEEAIQIGDLDKKYLAAQKLELRDPLALKIFLFLPRYGEPLHSGGGAGRLN